MKKLMIALSAATLVVLGAKAGVPEGYTGIDFETTATGPLNVTYDDTNTESGTGAKLWSSTAKKEDGTVDSTVEQNEGKTNTYLKIDETAVLTRASGLVDEKGNPVSAIPANGGNITISTKVQFTAAEEETQTPEPGDKLLVWLRKNADETLNLIITAKDATVNPAVTTHYVVSNFPGTLAENTWYDLKIVANKGEYDPTFNVFIGNTKLVAGEVDTFTTLSLGTEDQTISSIGFKGTGAVDDIGFKSEAGYVAPEVNVVVNCDYQFEEGAEITVLNEKDETEGFVAGQTITIIVPVDETYTVTAEGLTFAYSEDYFAQIAKLELSNAMAPTLTINVTVTAPSTKTPREQLDEAMAAVVAGTPATIKLAGDVNVGTDGKRTTALTIKADTDVTLDLAGNTISQSTNWYVIDVENGAKLTIVDTVGEGAITFAATALNNTTPTSMIRNKGLLTIKAGTFTTDYCVVKNDEDPGIGNLVIDGGTFTIVPNENGYTGLTWAVMNWGVATINGGTFNGDVQALSESVNKYSPESVLTINAGTFVPQSVYLRPYDKTTTPTIKVAESMKDTLTLVDTTPAAFNRKVVTTTADGYVTYKLADKAVYTVTFVADGTTVDTKEVVEGNSGVELPTEPTKEGYTFKGWFVEDVAFDATAEITANVTVTAKFEYIPVEVKFTVTVQDNTTATITINGEKVTEVPAKVTEGDEITVVFTADTGYTLNTDADATQSVTVGTEAVTITGPTATAIVPPAQNLPGTDLLPAQDAADYNKWADANGITMDSTDAEGAAAALAFKMGLTVPTGKTIAEAEQAAVDAAVAKIDVSKLATNLEAAVAAIAEQYPNVKVELVAVPQSVIATTAKLYKLKISLKPLVK